LRAGFRAERLGAFFADLRAAFRAGRLAAFLVDFLAVFLVVFLADILAVFFAAFLAALRAGEFFAAFRAAGFLAGAFFFLGAERPAGRAVLSPVLVDAAGWAGAATGMGAGAGGTGGNGSLDVGSGSIHPEPDHPISMLCSSAIVGSSERVYGASRRQDRAPAATPGNVTAYTLHTFRYRARV
jgi:hypothetical protein